MARTSACPVCRFDSVPIDAARCPQCDADLTGFRILDALPDEIPVVAGAVELGDSGRKTALHVIAVAALCLAAFVAATAVFFYRRFERRLEMQEAHMSQMERQFQERMAAMDARFSEPPPVNAPREKTPTPNDKTVSGAVVHEPTLAPAIDKKEPERFSYKRRRGETLWEIAKKFWGNGELYPALFEHNPDLGIYEFKKGSTVEVLKDAAAARDIFKSMTVKDGGEIYWFYKVREGDTLELITNRLYGRGASTDRIVVRNPAARMAPGEKLKIELE
jgi:hypothetical protein